MTTAAPATVRTRRHAKARALAATLALLAATLAAQPASATYIERDGEGEGGGGDGGGVITAATVYCHLGDAWYVTSRSSDRVIPGTSGARGFVWLLRPNNMCPDVNASTWRAPNAPGGVFQGRRNFRQVGHGWEVWRLYGTPDQVLGLSVSYAGTPAWGSGADVVTVAPHPDDNRAVPAGTLPWRSQSYISVGRDPISLFADGTPTTNPPFRFVDQRCTSLLPRRDPVALAMASNPTGTRDTLFNVYQAVASGYGGPAGWRVGAAAINARNTSPIAGPSSILTGDTRPCTSPYEYATYTPAEGLSLAGVATGVCVIPLTRLQLQLSDGSWATLRQYSHRYATTYGRSDSHDLWRKAIKAEVLNRSNSPYMLNGRDGELRPTDRDATPHPPSDLRASSPWLSASYNREQAAQTVHDYASCRLGFPNLPGLGEPASGPGASDPRLTITLEVPEVFQMGGALRPDQNVTVRHTPYTCGGGLPCPARTARQSVSGAVLPLTPDHLSHLSYRLEVSSTGLVLCQSSNPAERCDWRISGPSQERGATWNTPQPAGEPRSPSAQTTAASNWERVQTAGTRYFAATNPGEQVRARVTNVSGRYATYSWGTHQIGVTGCQIHVDGAELGTRAAAPSQGDLRRRRDLAPYFADTPGGAVSQYTLNPVWELENVIVGGRPVLEADGTNRQEWVFKRYDPPSWHTVDLWVCSTPVLDDWEVSVERPIPASHIRLPAPESRVVIGTVMR